MVWINPDLTNFKSIKYIILPFEDHNSAEDKMNYPQAHKLIRDALDPLVAIPRAVELNLKRLAVFKLQNEPLVDFVLRLAQLRDRQSQRADITGGILTHPLDADEQPGKNLDALVVALVSNRLKRLGRGAFT